LPQPRAFQFASVQLEQIRIAETQLGTRFPRALIEVALPCPRVGMGVAYVTPNEGTAYLGNRLKLNRAPSGFACALAPDTAALRHTRIRNSGPISDSRPRQQANESPRFGTTLRATHPAVGPR
jgi:hypothetical protein